MTGRLLPVAALVVVVIDATLLATGVIGPATALALFLAVEIPLFALAVGDYVRRYRHHRAGAHNRRDALRALAAADPFLRMMAAEARTFASLGRWIARRPDVPAGAVAIGYSRGTLGIPVALSVAAGIELVAVHLLIPWPAVRLVLDLLGVYALLMILGLLAGRIVRPHLIVGGELVLRSGPHVCARVPLDAIARVRLDRHLGSGGAEVIDDDNNDDNNAVLSLAGPDGTSVSLDLTRAVAASVPSYPWSAPELRQLCSIRLHVDDPDSAVALIRARLGAGSRGRGF